MIKYIEKLYKGRRSLSLEINAWAKAVFSFTGILSFFPILIAVILVYIGHFNGVTEASWGSVWKNRFENAAVVILAFALLLFLIAVIKSSKRIDIVLLVVCTAFLCREIHFAGTSKGVYVVVGIALILAWLWRDRIFDELDGRNLHKIAIFCLVWSYFVAIVIQRRAFSAKHFAILPDEQSVHVGLEELTEDFSHIVFLLLGVVSLFYALKKDDEKINENG